MDIELTLARVSVAQAAAQRDAGITTAVARARVAEARASARSGGSRAPRGASTPSCPARGCGTGPRRRPALVRRPLDAALHRGALTLRGYDRVLRRRVDARRSRRQSATRRRAHRPRALPEEGARAMTGFDLTPRRGAPRCSRAVEPPTGPRRRGCPRTLRARRVESPRPSRGTAPPGRLVRELGAARRSAHRHRRGHRSADSPRRVRRRAADGGCRGCLRRRRNVPARRPRWRGAAPDARPTRTGRHQLDDLETMHRCASGCAATPSALGRLQPSVALVGARAATSYGDHVALELVGGPRRRRHPGRLRRRLRHRRRRAPRGARRRRY